MLAALFVTNRPDPGNGNRAQIVLMSTEAAADSRLTVLTVLTGYPVDQPPVVRKVPASSVLIMSVPAADNSR